MWTHGELSRLFNGGGCDCGGHVLTHAEPCQRKTLLRLSRPG